jgi:membrane-bound inhibitor of C-type lysozyme
VPGEGSSIIVTFFFGIIVFVLKNGNSSSGFYNLFYVFWTKTEFLLGGDL